MFELSGVALAPMGTYKEGTRVVVNDGTGKKPHYFIGTVVKVGGYVTVHLDNGETRTLLPTKSKVGLVGIWYKGGKNPKELTPAQANVGMNPNVVRKAKEPVSKRNLRMKVRKGSSNPSPVPARPMAFIGKLAERLFNKEVDLDSVLEEYDDLFRENPQLLRALTNRVKLLQKEEEDRLPRHLRRGGDGVPKEERKNHRVGRDDPLADSFDSDYEGYDSDDYF